MHPERPNILIITTDQQRCDSLSCYGSGFTHTPNLDRLAGQGVRFDRAYCANPVCTPARASIFSGQYLSRHAAWNVGMNVPQDVPFLSHRLVDLGYRTHYVGKAHFQAFSGAEATGDTVEGIHTWESSYAAGWNGPYYGFETVELSLGHTTYGMRGHYGLWLRQQVSAGEYEAYQQAVRAGSGMEFGGEAWDWDIPTRLHSSTWTADRTIAFLEQHAADRGQDAKPFFLAVGFQDPHHPHCLPRDFKGRVDPAAVPLPGWVEGELADKPPHFELARTGRLEGSPYRGQFYIAGQGPGFDYRQVSQSDARLGRAYYYSMVRLIDEQAGRILDCLEQQGLAENTLVIFTTDHGELLGDHGLWMKGPFHYEELVHIPLLLRYPRAIPGGQALDCLASQVDIVPTVLAALGADTPPEVDGLNLLPVLQGGTPPGRDHILIECVDDPTHLRLKTVVTQDRKLTLYHEQPFGELYDLENDPGERRNHWDDPAYQPDRLRLTGQVVDHLERLERRAVRYSYA